MIGTFSDYSFHTHITKNAVRFSAVFFVQYSDIDKTEQMFYNDIIFKDT